jgi:predicted transcriptional regulator
MTSAHTLTSFDCVPEHMAQLGTIARSLGISRSALLRLMIAQYVKRAERRAALEARQK